MRPNVKYASLDELHASRLIRTLQTHPSPRVNLGSVILASYVLFLVLFMSWMLSGPPAEVDWTDTGVGCIDDCLEERGQP